MKVGIALIGAGGITAAHVRGYLTIADEARVVAVADVVEENARQRAAELGGAEVVADYHELLTRHDVDAVDICLPHHLHAAAIVAAAAAGKLPDLGRGRAGTSYARSRLWAHILFMPAVAKTRELLDAGLLGAIYELHTMDDALEARSQRIRHHLRRPLAGSRNY